MKTYSNSCSALDTITSCMLDWYYSPSRSGLSYPTCSSGTTYYYFDFPKLPDFPKVSDYPEWPIMDHLVYDNGDNELRFVATGKKKSDFFIKIEDDVLIVKTETAKEPAAVDRDGNSMTPKFKRVYSKISERDFDVSFKISNKLDTSKLTVKLEDGILSIRIPLSEEIKKKERVITID